MSTAALRDGRDHDTSVPGAASVAALVMLAAIAAPFASQQAAAQGAPCTAIQDDAERLACYDRALRGPPPAAPLPTAPAAQAPTVPPPQAPLAPPAEAPITNAAQASEVQSPTVQAPAPQSASAGVPAPATPAATKNLEVVIVGVRTLPGRDTVFTAQDGATWVQTDSQRVVGLPATPFDAELKPGAMGSTFLVPKNGARAIRVRPVER